MSKKDKSDSRKDGQKQGQKQSKKQGKKYAADGDVVPLEKAAEEVVPAMPKFKHVAKKKLTDLGYSRVRVFGGGKAEWTEAGNSLEVSA